MTSTTCWTNQLNKHIFKIFIDSFLLDLMQYMKPVTICICLKLFSRFNTFNNVLQCVKQTLYVTHKHDVCFLPMYISCCTAIFYFFFVILQKTLCKFINDVKVNLL